MTPDWLSKFEVNIILVHLIANTIIFTLETYSLYQNPLEDAGEQCTLVGLMAAMSVVHSLAHGVCLPICQFICTTLICTLQE